jgi:hypothetical protein
VRPDAQNGSPIADNDSDLASLEAGSSVYASLTMANRAAAAGRERAREFRSGQRVGSARSEATRLRDAPNQLPEPIVVGVSRTRPSVKQVGLKLSNEDAAKLDIV